MQQKNWLFKFENQRKKEQIKLFKSQIVSIYSLDLQLIKQIDKHVNMFCINIKGRIIIFIEKKKIFNRFTKLTVLKLLHTEVR